MWEQAKPLCSVWPSSMALRLASHPMLLTYCQLQEICCPPNTTGRGLAQAFSYIFCCPKAFSCCYLNEWHIPTPGGDGCCAFSLRCEPDLRFEYDDKMLAVIQRLPIHKGTSFNSQGLYNCPIPATIGPVKTPTLPSSLSTGQVVPKCASQTCQPGKNSQKDQVLRINDRTPGTQTAWRSMIDDIAAKSQAEEDWDGKNRKRRLRRLGCVVMALVVITLVMFIS